MKRSYRVMVVHGHIYDVVVEGRGEAGVMTSAVNAVEALMAGREPKFPITKKAGGKKAFAICVHAGGIVE